MARNFELSAAGLSRLLLQLTRIDTVTDNQAPVPRCVSLQELKSLECLILWYWGLSSGFLVDGQTSGAFG